MTLIPLLHRITSFICVRAFSLADWKRADNGGNLFQEGYWRQAICVIVKTLFAHKYIQRRPVILSFFRPLNPRYLQSISDRRISTTEFRFETSCHTNESIYKWVGCDCEYLHVGSEFLQLKINRKYRWKTSISPPISLQSQVALLFLKKGIPYAGRGILLQVVSSGHDPRTCTATSAREIHGLTVPSWSGVRPCCSFRQIEPLFATRCPTINTFWVGRVGCCGHNPLTS
jgi:hypothetical protein